MKTNLKKLNVSLDGKTIAFKTYGKLVFTQEEEVYTSEDICTSTMLYYIGLDGEQYYNYGGVAVKPLRMKKIHPYTISEPRQKVGNTFKGGKKFRKSERKRRIAVMNYVDDLPF